MPQRKLTDEMIDTVIQRHLERFDKPGVTSVRPGMRITNGILTHEPAIVVSVRDGSATRLVSTSSSTTRSQSPISLVLPLFGREHSR